MLGNRVKSRELMELGIRIRSRRIELKLSQEELAERAGINSNTVSRIEGGQMAMSVETFRKLVEVLCMGADTLLDLLDSHRRKAIRYKMCAAGYGSCRKKNRR